MKTRRSLSRTSKMTAACVSAVAGLLLAKALPGELAPGASPQNVAASIDFSNGAFLTGDGRRVEPEKPTPKTFEPSVVPTETAAVDSGDSGVPKTSFADREPSPSPKPAEFDDSRRENQAIADVADAASRNVDATSAERATNDSWKLAVRQDAWEKEVQLPPARVESPFPESDVPDWNEFDDLEREAAEARSLASDVDARPADFVDPSLFRWKERVALGRGTRFFQETKSAGTGTQNAEEKRGAEVVDSAPRDVETPRVIVMKRQRIGSFVARGAGETAPLDAGRRY